jgi:hypothetical protein
VVILDRAGWHRSQGLVVPGNIILLELPVLNPVERISHYLRSHWLANSVFPSLADIMDASEVVWNRFANNHSLVRSLCAVAWLRLRPLGKGCQLSNRPGPRSKSHSCREISADRYKSMNVAGSRRPPFSDRG